jgi:uncharacterized protein
MANLRNYFSGAVMPLLVVNVIFFALQIFLGRDFTNSLLLLSSDIFARPWILITHMFLHASPYHLLFNMYVLYAFGPMVEQRIGTKRFLFIYFVSGIAAAIVSSFFYHSALGASAAIMGILGVLIILMPELQLLFFFVIPMSLRTAAIIIVLIDVFGIIHPSGVANIAHLAGLACGLLYGLYLKKQKKTFNRKFSSKSHLDSDDVEEYLSVGKI